MIDTRVQRVHEALRERRRQKKLPRAVERLLNSALEKAQGRPGIYRMTFRVPRRLDDYVVLHPDGSATVVRFNFHNHPRITFIKKGESSDGIKSA